MTVAVSTYPSPAWIKMSVRRRRRSERRGRRGHGGLNRCVPSPPPMTAQIYRCSTPRGQRLRVGYALTTAAILCHDLIAAVQISPPLVSTSLFKPWKK